MNALPRTTSWRALHWTEYVAEAVSLGLFMVSACCFAVLLEHPDSPVRLGMPDAFIRRCWMGLAMGLTAVGLIHSPWGRRSGAHMNPAVTWTFHRLGKVPSADAVGYVLFQFLGGVAGVAFSTWGLGRWLAHPAVNYAVTTPGPSGMAAAFIAETVISFLLMLVVLTVSRDRRFERHTGWLAGACVGLFIVFEAPLSGMSMNPARTLGSALVAGDWRGLWLYFTAPFLGMLAAGGVHVRQTGPKGVGCAKLRHDPSVRCIFCEARSEAGRFGSSPAETVPLP